MSPGKRAHPMDDLYTRVSMAPETRAMFDELTTALVEAGLVEDTADLARREADAFALILCASRAVPLHLKGRAGTWKRPLLALRVRRALRPFRAHIRERLPLPDARRDPWIEEDETMRRILHGF